MNKLKTLSVCGILAVSMAGSLLAGCGKANGNSTALVVNGENINLGTAAFFLRYQQAESTTMMQSYGLARSGASIWSQQYTAATSSVDAQTYGDNLKSSAKDMLVQAVVLSQHADDYKVTIPDDLEKSLEEAAADTYQANKDALDEMGTSEDDLKQVLTYSTIQRLIFYPMVADTDTNVSDEDAAESTITYARISLTKYDSNTQQSNEVSDDDKNTYHKELEELLDQVKNSGDVASADIKTMATNLDNTNIAVSTYSYGKDDTVMPQEVLDAAKNLKDGEIYDGVIDTGSYYYLVRMDKVFDQKATDDNKQTIISERQQDNYQKKLKEWQDAATVEEKGPWKALTVDDAHGYEALIENTSSSSESVNSSSAVSSSSSANAAATSSSVSSGS